jgi:replicative DNA helicase
MEKDFLPHLKRIIENPHNEQGVLMEQVRKILLEYDIIERNDYNSKKVSDLFKDYSTKHREDKSSQFIQTGLLQYDEKVGGLIPGEFVVIGARPAMGKTHLIVNMALNISKVHPVLYYSLEISEMMLTSRIAAAITKIPTNVILSSELNEQQEASMLKLSDEIEKLQLYIYERNSNSMTGFKAMCREHVKNKGIKVVFVDYLQLLNSSRYRNNRELEIGYISRELKNIARELNICVVATSQLSRSVEQRGGDKRPILSDLRESGSIEQDADKVFFLYRPEYYGLMEDEEGNSNQCLSELILAKNRNGALTTIRLKHDPYFTSFVPLDEHPNSFSISKNRMDQIEPDKNSESESECDFPF